MPIDELQRAVATVALRAAAGHGFALAGGNALIAHGIVDRPTDDVDLFSDQEAGVSAAAEVVENALRAAGFQADRQDTDRGLSDVFYGMGDGIAEWVITAPGGQQTMLQLAYFDRSHRPVTMDVGPVLALADLAGSKVCALVLLTELPELSRQLCGWMSEPFTTVLHREPSGVRTGPGCSRYPSSRGTTRDRRPLESLPAA